MTHHENTQYGFMWGPMIVTRLIHHARGKREVSILGIETRHHKVEVSASRTGRSLRVWIDGVEVHA